MPGVPCGPPGARPASWAVSVTHSLWRHLPSSLMWPGLGMPRAAGHSAHKWTFPCFRFSCLWVTAVRPLSLSQLASLRPRCPPRGLCPALYSPAPAATPTLLLALLCLSLQALLLVPLGALGSPPILSLGLLPALGLPRPSLYVPSKPASPVLVFRRDCRWHMTLSYQRVTLPRSWP